MPGLAIRVLLASVGLAVATSAAAGQSTRRWAAAVDGNWNDPGAWTPAGVPNNTGGQRFNAQILLNGPLYTVTLDIPVTVQSFRLQANGGRLNLTTNDLETRAGFTFQRGIITAFGGSGTITVGGAAVFGNSSTQSVSALNLNGSALFDATIGSEFCDTGIDHAGASARLIGSGSLNLFGSSSFGNGELSTFSVESDADIVWDTVGTQPVFTNNGTLRKTAGAGESFLNGVELLNNGTLEVSSGTLRASDVQLADPDILEGGTWNVLNATLQLDGLAFLINRASVTLSGPSSVFTAIDSLQSNESDTSLRFLAGRDFTTAGTFTNDGLLEVDTGGTFSVAPGSSLTNIVGGTLADGIYILRGTFEVDGADITTLGVDSSILLDGAGSDFRDSAGAQSGLRNLAAIGAGASFAIDNGRDFTTVGNFTNDGSLTVGDASDLRVDPGSTLTNISGGTLTGGTYAIAGTLTVDGANLTTLDADVTLDGPASSFEDQIGQDAFRNLDTVDTAGRLALQGGRNFTTGGDLTVASTGQVDIGAGSLLRIAPGSTLTNFIAGEIVGGVFDIEGTLQFDGAAVNSISSEIVLDGAGSGIIDENGNDAFAALTEIHSGGRLILRNGRNQTLNAGLDVQGGGRLDVEGSSLTLTQGLLVSPSGQAHLAGGTITMGAGFDAIIAGLLSGSGTLNGSVVNAGQTAPGESPGLLTVNGNFQQRLPGQVLIEIDGTAPVDFDRIIIAGLLNFEGGFAGTLVVSVSPGYIPTLGDRFAIITYADRQGEFLNYQGLDLGGGLSLIPIYQPNRLVLRVVPAPGTLMVFGGLAALTRRRR